MDPPRNALRCSWKGVHAFLSTWFRPTFGSFITFSIAKLDKGLYTHAGLTMDGCFIDARARAPVGGKHSPTVKTTKLADLIASRDADAYDYLVDGKPNGSAIRKAFAVGDPDPAVPGRPTNFAFGGLMRLGIILATGSSRSPLVRRIGRWMSKKAIRGDPPGLFCSELVAKSMVMSDSRLVVAIDAGRDFGEFISDELIQDRLQAEGTPPPPIDGESGVAAVRRQLASVQEFLETAPRTSSGRVQIEVGKEERQLPAWLVTPHDLQEGESLRCRGRIGPA